MYLPQTTTATMMGIVVLAAIDCFMVRFFDIFAGGFLIAVALQIGLVRILSVGAREIRFWIGFEATGMTVLLVYLTCHQVFFTRLIVPWIFHFFGAIDLTMGHLPDGAFAWYRRYLFINPNAALRNIDIVALQEAAFGLPMLVLASAAGLLFALISFRPIIDGEP